MGGCLFLLPLQQVFCRGNFRDVAQPGSAWRRSARVAMEKFYTYILYSQTVDRFYVGSTVDLARRVSEHNSGHSKVYIKGQALDIDLV
ncbi:MAG: GIY-YIG nuclease family protein [Flavisolibacter sp.]